MSDTKRRGLWLDYVQTGLRRRAGSKVRPCRYTKSDHPTHVSMIHHSRIRGSFPTSGIMSNSRYLGPMDREYGKRAGHSVCEKMSREEQSA
jgi:hypothetical protein